jgi:uncharacterized protein YceK
MLVKKLLICALIASGLLSGCATIIDGKTQKINLETSKPTTVAINGQQYSAPSVIALDRSDKDAILVNQECNKTILLAHKINPTFFVNILSGGVIGSTTDFASGSAWEYDKSNINVECK